MPAMTQIHTHMLDNGLQIVGEVRPSAQSVAMSLLAPAGVAREPEDQQGACAMLAEMIFRGAGERDARAHSDALDQLGVQRGSRTDLMHLRVGATMLGVRLADALPLLTDMVRHPWLPESALEPSRDLALQAIEALEDEPQQKVLDALGRVHHPPPFGRSPFGRREDIEKLDLDAIRHFADHTFVPGGTIIGFAGNFDFDRVVAMVEQQLGNWSGRTDEPEQSGRASRGHHHHEAQSSQVHIGVAYDAVPEAHEKSMLQRATAAVLSGGMSSRLFTEVREKRGLCYAVGTRYAADRHRGAMVAYAGTTTARAQQTLDVLTAELRRISEGVAEDEFSRAIIGMKSHLVMQGESTSARAAAIASDQYIHGRPRSLEELTAEVDAITHDKLNHFVHEHRPGPMTVVTIGPQPLTYEET